MKSTRKHSPRGGRPGLNYHRNKLNNIVTEVDSRTCTTDSDEIIKLGRKSGAYSHYGNNNNKLVTKDFHPFQPLNNINRALEQHAAKQSRDVYQSYIKNKSPSFRRNELMIDQKNQQSISPFKPYKDKIKRSIEEIDEALSSNIVYPKSCLNEYNSNDGRNDTGDVVPILDGTRDQNEESKTFQYKRIHEASSTIHCSEKNKFVKADENLPFKDLDKMYDEYIPFLIRISEFMTKAKSEYNSMFQVYKKLSKDYNEQIGCLNDTENKLKEQIIKNNDNQEKLSELSRESEKLKYQHNILSLYKEEASKYTEIIKESLEHKNEEIQSLIKKNTELEKRNQHLEFQIEIEKGKSQDQRMKYENLENEMNLLKGKLSEVHGRVENVERVSREYIKKYISIEGFLNNFRILLYESAIGKIRIEIEALKNASKAILKIYHILKYNYEIVDEKIRSFELNMDDKVKEIETLKTTVESIENRSDIKIKALEKGLMEREQEYKNDFSKIQSNHKDLIQNISNKLRVVLETKLPGIIAKSDCIIDKVRAIDYSKSLEKQRKSFAAMLNNQRSLFEVEKLRYENIIRNIKNVKSEVSSDSDVWEVFK